jgi:hypothetical protein
MDRRELIKLGAVAVVSGFAMKGNATQAGENDAPVEQWGVGDRSVWPVAFDSSQIGGVSKSYS